jgi:hypothetical protein
MKYCLLKIVVFLHLFILSYVPNSFASAQNISFLLSQVRTSTTSLAGGKVYAYSAGTSAPKTIWLDANKTTVAANPYTLDSNATAQIYGGGSYRIVIKTSSGVTVYDRDNLYFSDNPVQTVETYGTLASAIASIGSTPTTLQFSTDQTLAASMTIPANIELVPVNGSKIKPNGFSLNYQGSLLNWPLAQVLDMSSGGAVTFGPNICAYPIWFYAGTGDATPAINYALLTGLAVNIDRTYTVDTSISLVDNTIIYGNGTIQGSSTFGAGNNIINCANKSGIKINGISIFGNTSALPLSNIQFQTCTNINLSGLTIKNASHEGIAFNQSSTNIIATDNHISHITSNIGWGIGLFWGVTDAVISNNIIDDFGAYGIAVDDGTSGQTDPLPSSRIVVSNNKIGTGIEAAFGVAVEGSTNITVSGNYINVAGTYGIDISAGNSVIVNKPKNIVVSGNYINAVTGIRMSSVESSIVANNRIIGTDQGVYIADIGSLPNLDNKISGNVFSGFASGSTNSAITVTTAAINGLDIIGNSVSSSGGNGVLIQAGTNINISNNNIKSCQKEGINAYGNISGLNINSNYIINPSLSLRNGYDAIFITSNTGNIVDSVRVSNNTFTDNQTITNARSGVLFYGNGGTLTNSYSDQNRAAPISISSTVILGTASVLVDGAIPSVPISGYWVLGRYPNATPTIGQPKGWFCTTKGFAYNTTRANSTLYTGVGQTVLWTTGTTVWALSVNGTTASSPPSITGKNIGDTVVDGTATWTLRSNTAAVFVSEGNL